MCGLAGFIDSSCETGPEELSSIAKRMADTLCHRGPDDFGEWVDSEAGIGLGHRRLSIIDLSARGHQPMHSECGRYVVAYNGEIYNFKGLRQGLEKLGNTFRSQSDTEVLLTAISQWGLKAAVNRFNGMFAFALWDRKDRSLHLVRDRLGIKPLYYGVVGKTFLFGSELKALRAHPGFKGDINRDAVSRYLRYSYIPNPHSIYSGIYKLTPGSIVSIDASLGRFDVRCENYWSFADVASQGLDSQFQGTEDEAVGQLDTLLRDAVKLRMEADVPLGAFLSGGVDSSTVVALMQDQHSSRVKTFSLGFYEPQYNEAEYAKAVANHLGTDHTELYVTSEDAREVIPKLAAMYDEPFSDSSQIPTFLVSELARQHVTVSLTGDGGDELFCGYHHYALGRKIRNVTLRTPRLARQALAKAITSVPVGVLNKGFGWVNPLIGRFGCPGLIGHRLHKLSALLTLEDPDALRMALVSYWDDTESLVIGGSEALLPANAVGGGVVLSDFSHRMMYLDTMTYLPDDILSKIDRASMSVGLEVRVPLLDHRVVEFAWQIPMSMKVRDGEGKWLLRQVLNRYLPSKLTERPKMGFAMPVDSWLRGPLRTWSEELLDEKRLRSEGIFDPKPIRAKWVEHLSGSRNWSAQIWSVLMFQGWLESEHNN